MEIRSNPARWIFALLMIVLYFLAVFRISKTYLAGAHAEKATMEDIQRAIQLDPDNAAYHLQLGSVYEYSASRAEPERALQEFRRAAELDPYNPAVWINLGGAAEFSGNIAAAEKYLRQADTLAPRLPLYQWRIGNFFLLHGDNSQAFAHFKMVLAGTREYDNAVFSTAWKASGNADEILQQLIPADLPAESSYLNYLIGKKQFVDTQGVWKRILMTSGPFPLEQAFIYIDNLIFNRLPDSAFEVWQDLQKKGVVRFAAAQSKQDLITNGGFEDDILNRGFAWRISPVDDVYAGLDNSSYHSASHALMVQFPGKQNLTYREAYQYVKVEPDKNYRLQGFIKTEGITTDSGPRVEVRDAYDPRLLDEYSESVTGTSTGWESVLLDFKTGPSTDLIVVSLTRLPSQKLDNQIAGKVWLDDLSLTPLR